MINKRIAAKLYVHLYENGCDIKKKKKSSCLLVLVSLSDCLRFSTGDASLTDRVDITPALISIHICRQRA